MLEFGAGAENKKSSMLTRRSLVAAAGILMTMSPLAAGKAAASGRRGGGNGGSNGNGGGRGGHGHGGGHGNGGGYGGGSSKGSGAHCFLSGTRISTPEGDVGIENLSIGDLVTTNDGTAKPVRWIGKMVFERLGQSWPENARPILIQKDALGDACPQRDLYLSRTHMLYLDGVLIPAGDLANGSTIAEVDPDTDRLEYFHIELDSHDVLLAEGAPCESLLVRADYRGEFDNADEYTELYGAVPSVAMLPCAPIAAFYGRRGALASRLRSALAPAIDIRKPVDVIRDQLEERAGLNKAA